MTKDPMSGVDLPPTERMVRSAEASGIGLPEHVRRAYRWNELRDAFLDRAGRIWFAEDDALRMQLPADPLQVQKIPPMHWHPKARREHFRDQHDEAKWQHDAERFEQEAPRSSQLALVD